MAIVAAGPFDVSLKPLAPYDAAPDALVGRMSLDKIYRGDLEATSVGEMLSAATTAAAPDSGTGELAGLTGTMHIDIAGGKPSYRFEYRIADTP